MDLLTGHRIATRLARAGHGRLGRAVSACAAALSRSSLWPSAEIGEGTVLTGLGTGICIHPSARIGERCRLGDDILVGAPTDRVPPELDAEVEVSCGARIVGPVRIGAGTWIGPNAVVDADVPPGARVEGGSRPEQFEGFGSEVLHMRPPGSMRIAQFTRAFYLGGTEGQVVELLRGLRARHELRVGCMDALGPLIPTLRQLGLEPEAFPLRGGFWSPHTAAVIGQIAKWLRRSQIDLVHVHDFSATLLVVPAAKLAGCRVLVGRLDLAHWHGPARRAALAALTHAADHVIANADAIRRMLIHEEAVSPRKISVIRNGIDLARFDARRNEPLESPLPDTSGEPVVVHVANMNPVKRHEDLLLSLLWLSRRGVRFHAFLVGDGPRRKELEELAAQLRLTDRVHFLGHRTDVPAIYARGHVGVLCSSAEGLSNAIIEGMAAGLPMVVTDAGGNPELVTDGRNGFVVPVGEPEVLARAIRRALEAPEASPEMGARGRELVERELTVEKLVRRHEDVYRYVVRASPRRLRAKPPELDEERAGLEDLATFAAPVEAELDERPGDSA